MGPISASLRPGNTASFEEMSQRWRVVGNTVSDLTYQRCKPRNSRSRDERFTARPTAWHRSDISSKEAVLPGRNDAEMGPANSLHASA